MPEYVVMTRTRTRDEEQLALYAKLAPVFLAGPAATFLTLFGRCEVGEGTAVGDVTIIEFPTFAEARAWDESPACQEAIQHAFEAATAT